MKHSSYLELLPVNLAYQAQGNPNPDLDNFLKIFESLLTASDETLQEEGIEDVISFGQLIDNAQAYSDPDVIPYSVFPDIAPWIARCLGVLPQQDWSYYQLKQLIKQILPIYRIRTTAFGMEYLFAILTTYTAQVVEILGDFGIGFYRQQIPSNDNPAHDIQFCSGRIGTVVGQRPENEMKLGGEMLGNFFIINLTISCSGNYNQRDTSLYYRVLNIFQWINEEKPVQSQFQLNFTTTPFQVGARGSCTLGVNTTLETKKTTRTINSGLPVTETLQQLIGTQN